MSLIDKNKIITEKDFNTVKARLLFGDYLMASIPNAYSFILFYFAQEYEETPSDAWKVSFVNQLIFPEYIETIKTNLTSYYLYKGSPIMNDPYQINMKQFLQLWEKLIK